jgi:hypothetical protein
MTPSGLAGKSIIEGLLCRDSVVEQQWAIMGRDPFLFDPLSSHHQVSRFSIRTGSRGSASGNPNTWA